MDLATDRLEKHSAIHLYIFPQYLNPKIEMELNIE